MSGIHNTTRPQAAPDLANTVMFLANRAVAAMWAWQFRTRSRRQLARMDDRQLRDIGLDPLGRDREMAKRFWQA